MLGKPLEKIMDTDGATSTTCLNDALDYFGNVNTDQALDCLTAFSLKALHNIAKYCNTAVQTIAR